jgi:hypothetical protein
MPQSVAIKQQLSLTFHNALDTLIFRRKWRVFCAFGSNGNRLVLRGDLPA